MAEGGESSGEDLLQRLPEDMMREILVKLPVKALLRTRCVSPYLYGLTKSPSFINMYIRHHSTTKDDQCLLVSRTLEGNNNETFVSFHSYETFGRVISLRDLRIHNGAGRGCVVCGPCDGLICLSFAYVRGILLCNPAMRESKWLPRSAIECPKGWELRTRVAVGLGLVPNTVDDYKVVVFVYLCKTGGFDIADKVEIYDLGTDSWQVIDCNCDPRREGCGHRYPLYHINQPSPEGTLISGRFHWVMWREDYLHALTFDLSNNMFGFFRLPSDWGEWPDDPLGRHPDDFTHIRRVRCVKVLNESLAFLSYSTLALFPGELNIDIWVMREYGVEESWTKRFTLGPFTEIRRPLCFWGDEALLMESHGGAMVSYDLNTHWMLFSDIRGLPDTMTLMVYKENLVSVRR